MVLLVAIVAALTVATACAQAAFPGQNGRIVFEGHGDLYTVNPDGTGQTTLVAGAGTDQNPAWSPDGAKVAFSRLFCDPLCGRSDIYVVNADGTGLRQLTDEAGSELQPAWSPDGRRIVFVRVAEEDFSIDLWVTNGVGTGLSPLTSDTEREFAPAWSPDGTKIAFSSQGQVRLMNADGSNKTTLAEGVGSDWSPDGSQLAFSRSQSDFFLGDAVYTINADGSDETLVFEGLRNLNPVWSPQGNKIAFDRQECAVGSPGCLPADVYTVNPDGTGLASVTGSNTTSDQTPDWQPLHPRPRRKDFKNGPAFCRAEREFLGEKRFAAEYGTNRKRSNAFGKCVSAKG